ncbi:MAG: hypothetical protein AAB433_00045 [Nitrospirota bacterium]
MSGGKVFGCQDPGDVMTSSGELFSEQVDHIRAKWREWIGREKGKSKFVGHGFIRASALSLPVSLQRSDHSVVAAHEYYLWLRAVLV